MKKSLNSEDIVGYKTQVIFSFYYTMKKNDLKHLEVVISLYIITLKILFFLFPKAMELLSIEWEYQKLCSFFQRKDNS